MAPEGRLDSVQSWLCLIDVNLEQETVGKNCRIAATTYDMIVLDYIVSEENNMDYPMSQVVAQLHSAPHPKLFMAYIDIGQAECYRTYRQPDRLIATSGPPLC